MTKNQGVQEELTAMLDMGVVKFHSDWSSQVVLVPKADGSVQICVDFRKVNMVSEFDA